MTKIKALIKLLTNPHYSFENKVQFILFYFHNRKDVIHIFKEIFIDEDYYIPLRNPKLIIDCGSNIGSTIFYFHELYPNAHIVGVEPSINNFNKLVENCNTFHVPASVENVALSDKEGYMEFYDHKTKGSTSVLNEKNAAKKGLENYNVYKVKVKKLSEYINSTIDLLKIDVEGSEYEILKDLDKSEKLQKIRNIVMEYHVEKSGKITEIAEILQRNKFDYQIGSFQGTHYILKCKNLVPLQ